MLWEMDISIISGQMALLHVRLEPGDGFEVYGGTSEDALRVERQDDEWLVTLDEVDVAGRPLVRFNVYARQVSTGREWVIFGGKVLVSQRTATAPGDVLAPVEYFVTVPVVENAVDLTGTAIVTGIVGPRGYSAYEVAVLEGFVGTEAEWLEYMRQQTATLAVEQVTPLMERAETAADKSEREATAAKTEKETAAAHAKAAKESELAAAEHKTAAAGEVTKAAAEVTKAAAEVEKAKQERETAAGHAAAAAKSAQDALANQQDAEQAAQDAAQAQVAARQHEQNAAAASQNATQKAKEATASAAQAAADKAAADTARTQAQAAQTKAELEAVKAEQNAALLGDAALIGRDNTFSGLNTFSAMTLFPAGAVFESGIPWIAATAMAFGVPPLAAYAETISEYRKLSNIDSVKDGESFCIFAPLMGIQGTGNYIISNRFSGTGFFVIEQIQNPCFVKNLRAITFSANYAVINPYRCEDIQLLHVSETAEALITWNHNFFSKAPDLNIYAPNLKRVTSGVLILQLNSVGTARIKLPSFNNNFTLKIGAMQKADVLYLLQNLPTLKTGVSRTAAISCDPALETDEDFLAQVAAFYEAETKTGWNVALTFQGNAIDAAAATYSMRRMTPPIFVMREECSGGAYVSADGKRWAIFSGAWVAAPDCGYTEFPNLESALEEWGLTEYVPEVPEETFTNN